MIREVIGGHCLLLLQGKTRAERCELTAGLDFAFLGDGYTSGIALWVPHSEEIQVRAQGWEGLPFPPLTGRLVIVPSPALTCPA